MNSNKNKFLYSFVTNVEMHNRVKTTKAILFFIFILICFFKDILKLYKKVSFSFEKEFNQYIIVIESFNNLRALEFLFHTLDKSSISVLSKSQMILDHKDYKGYNNAINWNGGIKFAWFKEKYRFLFSILYSKNTSNYLIKHIESDYYFIVMFNELLSTSDLKSSIIITSNDINVFSRSTLFHCNSNNIKNIYIQHANVSKFFPKLTTTLAVLYGRYSSQSYQKNESVKVEIVGNHLFDSYKDLVLKKAVNISKLASNIITIGIAYNTLDDVCKISKLISTLNQQLPFVRIIVRAHPRDKRTIPCTASFKVDKSSDVIEFFNEIDVLIAAVSGITLEAALLNIYPIIFDFRISCNLDIDYYDYIKNDLAPLLDNNEIVSLMLNIYHGSFILSPTRNNCTFYDASIGSRWEFDTKLKITELIKSI
jgi:hypothetical protein